MLNNYLYDFLSHRKNKDNNFIYQNGIITVFSGIDVSPDSSELCTRNQ